MKKGARIYSSRPVGTWLFIGVGMLIVQILLGGITRISGSGLSITEWNLFTSFLPPLNEQQWMEQFAKYQHTPQFQLVNFDFTLSNFKFIFFWEWFHRLWAKLMGVVFLIPFLIFLVQRRFRKNMIKPLLILFLLGALQGTVGWIMVLSGLTGDATYVAPAKLALHFIFALGLLAYTYWFALSVSLRRQPVVVNSGLRTGVIAILLLLVLQLLFGALMAGNKAATAAPTWPDINGSFIPPNMIAAPGGLYNLLQNKTGIHFMHRMLAYLIFLFILIWTFLSSRQQGTFLFNKSKYLPILLVSTQVLLGILAVIRSTSIVPNKWGVFEWMAQLHQIVAILLLLSLILMLYILRRQNAQHTIHFRVS